jgi:hypothetical protein
MTFPEGHPCQPSIKDRISNIKRFEKQWIKENGWKKRRDHRCPECGGMLSSANRWNGGKEMMECMNCLGEFVVDDYKIEKSIKADISYLKYLKGEKEFHESLGFYDIETQIIKKWNETRSNERDTSFVSLKDKVKDINTFEIAWCVLKELDHRTGSIRDSNEYNAITRKAFDAIELNKMYTIVTHIDNPLSWWEKNIWGCVISPPYISSIKGLILEENKVGIDYRVYPDGHDHMEMGR